MSITIKGGIKMKLKQLKQWINEAEKAYGENAIVEIFASDSGDAFEIENMFYDFSNKVLKLEIEY